MRAARGARDLALEALVRVDRDEAFASAALGSVIQSVPRLDPRDRALATELTYGVLRWRGALDGALEACAPRGIGGLDREVLSALRIATYQLLHLDRIPPAAAVSAAVEQVRQRRGERLASFTNGVLRSVDRSEDARARGRDLRRSVPGWLSDALGAQLGPERLERLLRRFASPSPLTLRTNVRRVTPDALAERIRAGHPEATVTAGLDPPGALRVEGLGDPQATAEFRQGLYTVQDLGAQQVVAVAASAVGSKRGPRVLDACAGRGGKTGALLEALGPEVALDAVDRHPDKLERLRGELDRLGLGPVEAYAIDLERGTGRLVPGYDLVLLDAPCTGTGTIGRRPEIRWRLTAADVPRLAAVQRTLLERVAPLLAPGGTLVYCVCSVLPAEGPEIVRAPPPGLHVDDARTLWPDDDGTDGFYWARLVARHVDLPARA